MPLSDVPTWDFLTKVSGSFTSRGVLTRLCLVLKFCCTLSHSKFTHQLLSSPKESLLIMFRHTVTLLISVSINVITQVDLSLIDNTFIVFLHFDYTNLRPKTLLLVFYSTSVTRVHLLLLIHYSLHYQGHELKSPLYYQIIVKPKCFFTKTSKYNFPYLCLRRLRGASVHQN